MVSSKVELQRCLELSEENISYGNFYDAIASHASLRSYTYGLRNFMDFLVEKKHIPNNEDYTTLSKFDADKSTDLVKAYIKKLKKRVKPPSVNAYVAPIFLFFDMNRTAVFKKEINRVKDKNDLEQGGHTPVTDAEIYNMISLCNHPRDTSLILFLSSTGMRPGGFNDPILKMKHLIVMTTPTDDKCYGLNVYDESRQKYWVFLTPEATTHLDKYFTWRKTMRHEEFTDDSPVFVTVSLKSKFKNMTMSSLYHLLEKIYNKSGLVRKKTGFRYDKAITYMYRIRFNTILKLTNQLNSNIAEKLMAHKKGLDGTYLQPTREECFAEFVKAIPGLTIDPTEKQRLEIQKKEEEITELQAEREMNVDIQKQLDQMKEKQKKMELLIFKKRFPNL